MSYLGGFVQGAAKGAKQAADEKDAPDYDSTVPWKDRMKARFKSFKKGGKVKHTGLAKVDKGERVLTKKEAKKYRGGKKG